MARTRKADQRAELAAEVSALVRAVYVDGAQRAADATASVGIHQTDMAALRLLHHASGAGVTIGQLGAKLGLSSPAVTGLVDRLEAGGLVHRVRDDDDRRRVFVQATPRSYEVGLRGYGPLQQRIAGAVEHCTADELAVVRQFLARVLADEQ